MGRKFNPRSVDSLVNEQIARWKASTSVRGGPAAAVEVWPLITLSREFGSRGARVGQMVAERFGFSFWDQELVGEVARRSGAREALVSTLDEQTRSRLDEFVAHIFTADGTSAEFLRHMGQIVRTLERKGGAVVVGRGGPFLVKPDTALRVRIVCPVDQRVASYAQREGLDLEAARRAVDGADKDRHAFYQRHFKRDVADAHHYDIVVNTGGLSLEAASELVVVAYQQKFGRLPG